MLSLTTPHRCYHYRAQKDHRYPNTLEADVQEVHCHVLHQDYLSLSIKSQRSNAIQLLTLHLVQMLPRLSVMLPAPHRVIHARNDQHSAEHDRRPIHVLSVRRYSDRKERGNG
jgi:hypothetical protein